MVSLLSATMLHPTQDFIMKHRYFTTEYILLNTKVRLGSSGQPLPYPPEDQCQEQDRQPLTYDYNRQGTVIVIHAQSGNGRGPDHLIGRGKLAERV
jgi:hypothetical protein